MKLNRIISALLLLALLLSCLPLGVSATDDENSFYFSAETSKTLVVSPQKIPYSDDQTIAEALTAAGIVAASKMAAESAAPAQTVTYLCRKNKIFKTAFPFPPHKFASAVPYEQQRGTMHIFRRLRGLATTI